MAKTKEELQEIKKDCITFASKISELSDDELEIVTGGDNIYFVAEVIYPVASEEGLRFSIREGGRTVGSGQVTDITN